MKAVRFLEQLIGFFTAVVCFSLDGREKGKWIKRTGRDPEESWNGMLSLVHHSIWLECVAQR